MSTAEEVRLKHAMAAQMAMQKQALMNAAVTYTGNGQNNMGGITAGLGPYDLAKQAQMTPTKYKRTTIFLDETSNGTCITINEVRRICPVDGDLMSEVAAAYTESRLQG